MASNSNNGNQDDSENRRNARRKQNVEPTRTAPDSERGLTPSLYFNGPLYNCKLRERTNALSSFKLRVVDLAKGPPVLGSLARSTTSTLVLYLDKALRPWTNLQSVGLGGLVGFAERTSGSDRCVFAGKI